jgi:hypothetical protein
MGKERGGDVRDSVRPSDPHNGLAGNPPALCFIYSFEGGVSSSKFLFNFCDGEKRRR